ncbi:MAG: DUF5615 family PIN-like protein, partial [Gammaproteobacteria bacterium]
MYRRRKSGFVKLLLDENFPLPLYHELRAAGYSVEHIIVFGQRGLPDAVIRKRLASEFVKKPTALGISRSGGARNPHVFQYTLRFLRSGGTRPSF